MEQRTQHGGLALKTRPKPPAEPPAAESRRSQPSSEPPPPGGQLVAVREAVRNFLVSECQAREVRVTKIGPLPGEGGWGAEAEFLMPDLAIKMLGLPLNQEVLEREFCAVELDNVLSVRSYEFGVAAER